MENPNEYEMTCELCGQKFDLRNIEDVFYHLQHSEENPIKFSPGIVGERVFNPKPLTRTVL